MGHSYMRAIEEWLRETGWGCDVPDSQHEPAEEVIPEEQESDSGVRSDPDEPGSEQDEGEIGEGELSFELDLGDDEDEIVDEETMEGEFGYSTF